MLFSRACKVSPVSYDEISIYIYIYTSSGRKPPNGGDGTLDIGTSNILEGYISTGFYHIRGPRLELAPLRQLTCIVSRMDSSWRNYVRIYKLEYINNGVIKFLNVPRTIERILFFLIKWTATFQKNIKKESITRDRSQAAHAYSTNSLFLLSVFRILSADNAHPA